MESRGTSDTGSDAALSIRGSTTRQMLALWTPLAASIVIMVLEPSVVNVALGRLPDPELALAGYGVAYSLALLIEAPILMLIDASVALSTDRVAFSVLRSFTLLLGVVVAIVGLAVSLTPLYELIVVDLMAIPVDVAAWARPVLAILSFWPLPIAWRRTYQGVLVRAAKTTVITAATAVRLVVLAAALFGGLRVWPAQGAILSGVAMDLSVVVEAALITWAAGPLLHALPSSSTTWRGSDGSLTPGRLWRFYRPLLATSLLRQAARPVLSAGVAAAGMARASLAAWPVVWGLAILVAGPPWALQQLTTALATNGQAYRRVWRFSLVVSAGFTLLLVLAAFTPLYGLVMGDIYNLSPDLQALAHPGFQLLAIIPMVMGVQSVYRGWLIRKGCTKAVRSATVVNVVVLVIVTVMGVNLLPVSGLLLAALATIGSNLAELAWLQHESPRCWRWGTSEAQRASASGER